MKKITLATFKSFLNKNKNFLYVKVKSSFDGMIDCVSNIDHTEWKRLHNGEGMIDNTLGYNGIWLVGSSRDYFKEYQSTPYKGIEVSNCCGSFVVAYNESEVI